MDSDDYYNPRLKHSFEYQEMFSRLRYTQPTQQLPVIRYPLSIKFPETQMMNFILMVFNVKYFGHNKLQINEFLKIPKSIQTHITKKIW
jgi:hypothetical protein